MDASGLLLLLVVVVCVIVLISIAKKTDKSEGCTSGKTDLGGSSAAKQPVIEVKVEEKGPLQVTIYEYCPASTKCLCVLCGGENDVLATHCHICGHQLR